MECFSLDVRLSLPGYDSACGRFQISRGALTRSDPGDIMAQAAQMNVIEINSPIRVEHDRKRRQFSIRLNGTVTHFRYYGETNKQELGAVQRSRRARFTVIFCFQDAYE